MTYGYCFGYKGAYMNSVTIGCYKRSGIPRLPAAPTGLDSRLSIQPEVTMQTPMIQLEVYGPSVVHSTPISSVVIFGTESPEQALATFMDSNPEVAKAVDDGITVIHAYLVKIWTDDKTGQKFAILSPEATLNQLAIGKPDWQYVAEQDYAAHRFTTDEELSDFWDNEPRR